MSKKELLPMFFALCGILNSYAQGAKNIVISEVVTVNETNIEDEYGDRKAWIELANVSYSSYDVRGMFLTTDRSVLDKRMTASERMARMCQIPSGEHRTLMGPRSFLLFFANSMPSRGKLHLSLNVNGDSPVWIALYNGNGTELIDSVTVPRLLHDQSYANIEGQWHIQSADNVTAGQSNIVSFTESKIEKFKREDPHGFAMSIMAMSIVFLCLALLWVFFYCFGAAMRHIETARKVVRKQPIKPITKTVEKTIELSHKTGNLMQDGLGKKGIDIEIYMAVIGMALKQYEDDVHDVESGVITIQHKDTEWDDEYTQMTQWHNPVLPLDRHAPTIPTTPELK